MSTFTQDEATGIFRILKSTIPYSIEQEDTQADLEFEDLLNSLSSDHKTQTPVLISTESHGPVIIVSAAKHTFPSSKSQWFVAVVSPQNIAGVYALKADKAINHSPSFKINDEVKVANLDFPDVVLKDEIKTRSFVPFPSQLFQIMEVTEFKNSIDPKALAEKINKVNLPEVTTHRLLEFLFQCHVTISGSKIFRLASPSARGRESWTSLRSSLLMNMEGRHQPRSPEDESEKSQASMQGQESPSVHIGQQQEVSSDHEPNSRYHGQHVTIDSSSDDSDSADSDTPPKRFKSQHHGNTDIVPWIKELQTLNATMVNHFMNVSASSQNAQVLSLEDKSSWFKKAPETIREWLINLRAGPTMTHPTELSSEIDSILKQTSSKQQADIQIPVIISKAMNVRQFDCMASGQDYENWFKHGEFKQSKMVIKFSDAFGMNLHSLGPKNPINKPITVTSNNGLKHKVFIPAHFVELEDSASNLLAIASMIAGAGHESFATIALKQLLEFYRSFKSDIKQMCEIRRNLLEDIQMQLGNEWNAFLIKASVAPPNFGPDFACVTSQIEKGKLLLPFLPESPPEQPEDLGSRKGKKPGDKKNNSSKGGRMNYSPQLRMEGATDAERHEQFRSDFLSRKGVFKELNLPKVDDSGKNSPNGKPICMYFHLKHKCGKGNCNLFHGKISDDVVAAILTKTASKNLKVTKM